MKLPTPPADYSAVYEGEKNRILEQADIHNVKRLADIEVVAPQRLILRSPDGTQWKLVVSNTGTLSATTL